jgi:hypothetical protein
MRRLLLDANMPRGLRALLADYEVRTARQMGWDRLTNGELLAAAEAAGFDAMITADRNIRYQQNLIGRKIALIELTTTHRETIRENFTEVKATITDARVGSYAMVRLPRPPRVRRPYTPRLDCQRPGFDIRPIPPSRDLFAYGFPPPRLFDQLMLKIVRRWTAGQGKSTPRN